MDKKEIYKDLYLGYISKSNPEKEPSEILDKCLKNTSKELNIPQKDVENYIYSLASISRMSLNFPLDRKTLKKVYNCSLVSEHGKTEYYIDNSNGRIYDNSLFEMNRQLTFRKFFIIVMVLLDTYKYIDPTKLKYYSYIMELNNMSLPSDTWLQKQEIYILGIDIVDSFVLKYYTGSGYLFINNYLRGKEFIYDFDPKDYVIFYKYYEKKMKNLGKKFTQEEMFQVMKNEKELKEFAEFISQKLNKIILNSPKVDEEFIVYRGTMTKDREDIKGKPFSLLGFTSTSFDVNVSLNFSIDFSKENIKKFNYIEKIIIPKNSRILFIKHFHLFYGEKELLLPLNSNFKIIEECKNSSIFDIYGGSYDYENKNKSLFDKVFSYVELYLKNTKEEDESPVPSMEGKMCLVEYIP